MPLGKKQLTFQKALVGYSENDFFKSKGKMKRLNNLYEKISIKHVSEQIFTNTLIFLGAAIIMVPLVRKLGFSSVIGYILGGIIIGPFVLKLTGNADDVMHATEFGVVMLLFIVGLELEPKKFWSMRRTILGLGGMQMLATTAFLFLIFYTP